MTFSKKYIIIIKETINKRKNYEKVKNYKEKTINNEDALRTDIGKVKLSNEHGVT